MQRELRKGMKERGPEGERCKVDEGKGPERSVPDREPALVAPVHPPALLLLLDEGRKVLLDLLLDPPLEVLYRERAAATLRARSSAARIASTAALATAAACSSALRASLAARSAFLRACASAASSALRLAASARARRRASALLRLRWARACVRAWSATARAA